MTNNNNSNNRGNGVVGDTRVTRGDGTEGGEEGKEEGGEREEEGGEEILAHGWEGLAKVVQEDLVDLKIGRLDRRSGYPLASITTKAPVGLKI